MSKHRRVSGKHRTPNKTINPVPALVLAGAYITLVTSPVADPASADFQSGIKYVAAEANPPVQLAVAPAKPVVVAESMLLPTVPIEGEYGLTHNARALANYISTHYHDVRSIGGVRSDPLPDHPSGHAIDIMVYGNTSLGDTICADVLSQAERFGVKYVIWQETYRSPSGRHYWMANRGSVTANHFDHVHVTVY